jgi:hypothetical protein
LNTSGLISGAPTAAGTFPFTVTATDQTGASASLALSISVTPALVAAPTVLKLQRFGFHAQPTTFVLTFSTPLDQASAQNVANYRLNSIVGTQLGQAIPIMAAVYDATAHTVTLHTARPVNVFRQYRLLVNGTTPTGVKGATGLLLDGKGNGQPGSDYVMTFGMEILAGPNVHLAPAQHLRLHRSRSATLHTPRHILTRSALASTHAPSLSAPSAPRHGVTVMPMQPEHRHP